LRPPDPGEALATAAEQLIGIPFRLHGRNPETGLDCVGVVAAALLATGAKPFAPSGYALRNLTVSQWLHHAGKSGLTPAPGPIQVGDVLLLTLGHCQHHLAIATASTTVVHAHAGLRQVVKQPLQPGWRVTAKWRAAPSMKV
jgi:cell wall-associated NlpC family hydrolase